MPFPGGVSGALSNAEVGCGDGRRVQPVDGRVAPPGQAETYTRCRALVSACAGDEHLRCQRAEPVVRLRDARGGVADRGAQLGGVDVGRRRVLGQVKLVLEQVVLTARWFWGTPIVSMVCRRGSQALLIRRMLPSTGSSMRYPQRLCQQSARERFRKMMGYEGLTTCILAAPNPYFATLSRFR